MNTDKPESKPEERAGKIPLKRLVNQKTFPFGINSEMDRHAATNDMAHWSCVSPKSKEWWVRIDGQMTEPSFNNDNGYVDSLKKFDKTFPIFVKKKEKPPLGLTPKEVHNSLRMREILEAVDRYSHACKPIPAEWVEELWALVG